MKVREALAKAAERLLAVPGLARLDAELLMAAALGVGRSEMLLSRLDDPAPPAFDSFIGRRLATEEPVDYIIGCKGFWTIELEIGPGVLIPRADSETLIAAAVDHFAAAAPTTILDLGTGPGTLLLAALDEWPSAHGLGVDISEEALAYARRNAERLGVAWRLDLRRGNWADGIDERFDLVLCNPPYVETSAALIAGVADWEPPVALFGGADGLAAYRMLAAEIPRLLAPDGVACIEIGHGQEEAVAALFEAQALRVEARRDLAGTPRCLLLAP
jgi:release factor glutamine methyltransferase